LWIGCAQLAMTSVAMLAADPALGASCNRYRAIDLGPIPSPSAFNAPEFGDNTFGVNGKGEAVFVVDVNPDPSGATLHAYIWLPKPAYNLSAGLHDLHMLSSPSLPHTQSMAMDINDAGIIVGWSGNALADPRARAWRLDQYTTGGGLPHIDLHSTTGQRSIAHGINNNSPARVVGYAEFPCSGDPSVFLDRAFHIPALGTTSMLQLDPAPAPTGQSIFSYALAVNSMTDVAIGGRDDLLPVAPGSCNEQGDPTVCDPRFMDPVRWLLSETFHPNLMPRLGPAPPTGMGGGTEARGVNNNGEHVGLAYEVFSLASCPRRATMWIPQPPPDDELLVNLHSIAGFPELQESRAEAISDPNIRLLIRVVGANTTENRAWVWERNPSGAWCARRILSNTPGADDVTLSCVWNDATGSCISDVFIERAHDVNVAGHIIAYGQRASENFRRAYYLTCRSDIHNFVTSSGLGIKADTRVDGADQGQLLLHWGECPGGPGSCPEDLNEDGLIDGTDLGILLIDWSPDNPARIQPPLCETCGGGASAMAGGGEEDAGDDATIALALEEALWMVGIGSIDDYVAWALEASPDEAASAAELIHNLLTD
jgi:hypothetical protein